MSENKEVLERSAAETGAASELVLQPPVDISEDADGISLVADLPGVSRDRLHIHVDRDTLTIEGEARLDMPEHMKPLYADVRSTRYRRSFALSSELDTHNIEAQLKDGVLNLRIHKRPESRPRKIEVAVG